MNDNPHTSWPRIAVVGAGAVGCYFGGMLARAGAPVTLIGRTSHVEAISRNGLLLDTVRFRERVSVAASTEIASLAGSDLVLLCVKTVDTTSAAETMKPHVGKETLIFSLQNGVDNVEKILAATGIRAYPAVVHVAAEMIGAGHVKHNGRGDLTISDKETSSTCKPASLAEMFIKSGIPCHLSDNIAADLWMKLSLNCAFNAISALSRAKYGNIGSNSWTREVMRQAVQEVVAVGRAMGVEFPPRDLVEAAFALGVAMPGATSSTAQDIDRHKATEIDSLNGYVVLRGKELGIQTPVNQTLHALVKLLEDGNARPQL